MGKKTGKANGTPSDNSPKEGNEDPSSNYGTGPGEVRLTESATGSSDDDWTGCHEVKRKPKNDSRAEGKRKPAPK